MSLIVTFDHMGKINTHIICLSKIQHAISGFFTITNTEHYITYENCFKANFHFNYFNIF